MKKHFTVLTLAALILALTVCAASADTVTTSGTVVSTKTEIITASLGGTIEKVLVSEGDHVSSGDTLVTLATQKVYALQSGTVRIFGEVGDSASMISDRYGAVAYIEPEVKYTISASTKYAYDKETNKIIHPGETVYLKAVENVKNTGTGVVTSVSGTSYNVELVSGSFSNGESVYIFRKSSYAASTRIGRGTVAHQDPVAYTGEGVVVKYPVKNGSKVTKGTVLFETLSGTYANQTENLKSITATRAGVVASISLNKGGTLNAGDTVISLYADADMRVEAMVSEEDLQYFRVGSTVKVTFTYLDNGEYTVNGTIEKASRISASTDEETNEASYSVLIKLASTSRLYYGMNAVIEAQTE